MSTTLSPSLADLATALAKAQAEIRAAAMDATNPHYKSKYANLASIWDACRGPLTANGLSVIQLPGYNPDHHLATVRTILLHESGQSVESVLCCPVQRMDAQGVGSALTYLRRYSLAATVGVAPDDDDDGEASKRPSNVDRDGVVKAAKPVKVGPDSVLGWGKLEGKKLSDVPDAYLNWMAEDGRKFGSQKETEAWQEAARMVLDGRREPDEPSKDEQEKMLLESESP